ncbi:MAG: GNAT family N-acetyltransferase, partial [Solirubrobacterales bacterium]|nr:GNAT family N-acetyltransferase [Solirubrobacterales bacterium]
MRCFPLLADPLSDGRVVLRDYAERDIPEILIAHQDDPRMHLLTGEDRAPSGAELGRAAEREAADRASGERATLTIVEPGEDTCRGQIRVYPVDWDQSRAEVGIWLAPQVRGHGLGRRALRLAGQWLLWPCGLARVELFTEPNNAPMIRAAEGAGFAREGVLREYLRRRGKGIDVAVMSLV